jgi:hypothetical protein
MRLPEANRIDAIRLAWRNRRRATISPPRSPGETNVRKSDLEEQIDTLQDVLTDIREMIYGALEPTDDDPDTQVENLRNTLADIEDMIDSALEPLEMEEEEEEDEEEDDDEGAR